MSSSSLSSRSKEKSVYIRTSNGDNELEFYSFALNEDAALKTGLQGRGGSVLTPIKAADVPMFGGCAAVGKTIYCFGGHLSGRRQKIEYRGSFRPLDSVFSLNTRHLGGQSWKKRAPMRHARTFYPTTVAFEGKIYVFGGLDNRARDPKQWAEVFDTKSGQWAPLPPPPPPAKLPAAGTLFAVHVTSLNKIIVGSRKDEFLYAYGVNDGHWERFDNLIIDPVPFDLKPVAVGTKLFWFHEGTLYLYDFITKLSGSCPVKDLDKVVPPVFLMSPYDYLGYPPLLHVAGNVFCFLCLECVPAKRYYLLHCIKFSISDFVYEGGEAVNLHAAVVSSEAYVIEETVRFIDAGLM
ncbi:hypothetical protein Vadar_031197 [Vaccinium darrowii]|uniref:Uncharacterized protein n=1 Tax=Vaccinium darrowii TaxID=229202 RepID=A0ACB7XLB6_9ERIC|nr:hypothetical protein Vadar_031197 [Vaccinium darrowii]